MSAWQQQIYDNAAAIQQLIDSAKKIGELPAITGAVDPYDKIALEVASSGLTVYATVEEILASTSSTDGQTVLYSGDAVWLGGLDFYVWADWYRINGYEYVDLVEAYITLDAADGTFDRIDVFKIWRDGGGNTNIDFEKGTPSTPAVKPTLNEDTELEISFAYIEQSATSPRDVTNDIIYAEGGEWTISGGDASIDTVYSLVPIGGAISIRSVDTPHDTELIFTASSPIVTQQNHHVSFDIFLETEWEASKHSPVTLDFYVLNGGDEQTSRVRIGADNGFGFDPSLTGEAQNVTIRLGDIKGFFSENDFDGIKFKWKNTQNDTFKIDNIRLQDGITSNKQSPQLTHLSQFINDVGFISEMSLFALTDTNITLAEKGDILAFNGTSWVDLSVGANGTVLTADSAEATGLKWTGAGAGDMVLASVQTVTGLKTFNNGTFALRNVADTFSVTFTNTVTADRVLTVQDADGTLAYLTDIFVPDTLLNDYGYTEPTHALPDLTDVTSAIQTAGFALMSDGGDYYGRAITEADISDLGTYQLTSEKGQPNGYASLDGSGLVPSAQLPAYVDDVLEFADLASFPGTGETGKIYVALDTNLTYRWSGSVYVQIASGAVQSVNSQTGVVVLDTDDISEGATNKYYSTTLFNTDFGTKTTDDLTEGSTNLYDQVVSFTGGTNVTIGGTYPNFSITDNSAASNHTHSAFDRPTSVLTDAEVFSDIVVVDGIVTAISTRSLALGDSFSKEITQNGHGFVVNDAIRHNGTNWVKAQADAKANAGTIGVVSNVQNPNTFTYTFGGFVAGAWTNGVSYFLSPTVAGAIIAEPTYNDGEVREFIGTGTPDGLLLELDLGDVIGIGTPAVTQLDHLDDVISATNTAGYVLVANGTTGYIGRALVLNDISDYTAPTLYDILKTDGTASTDDGFGQINMELIEGGGSYLGMVFGESGGVGADYCYFDINKFDFIVDNGDGVAGTGGQMWIQPTNVQLNKYNNPNSIGFHLGTPTQSNIDFYLETPSFAKGSENYVIPISVNGVLASATGDVPLTLSDLSDVPSEPTGGA